MKDYKNSKVKSETPKIVIESVAFILCIVMIIAVYFLLCV